MVKRIWYAGKSREWCMDKEAGLLGTTKTEQVECPQRDTSYLAMSYVPTFLQYILNMFATSWIGIYPMRY